MAPAPARAPSLQALRAQAATDAQGALGGIEAFVREHPRSAEAHFLHGQILARLQQSDAALAALRTAEQLAPHVPLSALGQMAIYKERRNFPLAHAALDRAVSAVPRLPDAASQRAALFEDEGRLDAAYTCLNTELERIGKANAPARLLNNYGHVLRALQRVTEAITAFGEAIARDPGYELAYRNLADTLFYDGQMQGAEAVYRTLTERFAPRDPPPWRRLGHALNALGETDLAESAWRAALDRGDTEPRTAQALLFQLKRRNATTAAITLATEMLARDPHDVAAAVAAHLTLPAVYADRAEVLRWREHYAVGLTKLAAYAPTHWRPDDVLNLTWSNFHLAYQGEDDAPLQRRWAELVSRWLQAATATHADHSGTAIAATPRTGRIRIGFWSSFLRDCTVGKYFESWITGLPPDAFEVIVFHASFVEDAWVARLRQRVARHIRIVAGPEQHAQMIRAQQLDVLVYPEIGMDAATAVLCCQRLAPLQVALWGHPVTTGSPMIDHYMSVAVMEPTEYAQHYREAVTRMPGLGTCYARPMLSDADAALTRAELGLPMARQLLLLPQSAFKIHPDNDALLGEVLRRCPQADLVLFEDAARANSDAVEQRLAAVMPQFGVDWARRRYWLPRSGHGRYLAVTRSCDLMLDTLHWSGGNTSLDALAMGVPIITLPGAFMRGRQSVGMLQLMGITRTCVASVAEYVDRVAHWLGDPQGLTALRREVLAAADRLFDDPEPIAAWVDWLHRQLPGRAQS
jgi:protein O-GlcNAc transferase